ncbi:MAG: helix-turn-helix domain-containing protein, partial [Candidatus Eisenbacteria bacterium]|nr:helix-turn-helix domain-containing protein [Candidatus Eisenbacteria bacterium]
DLEDPGLTIDELASGGRDEDLLALDRALEELGRESRRAKVVLLRFLVGLSVAEVAEVLGTSVRTVEREWHFARLFLFRALSERPGEET